MGSSHDSRTDALLDFAGRTIRDDVQRRFLRASVLDVGAGWGKYGALLPGLTMDAVEVWQPYIAADRLWERYRRVWIGQVEHYAFDWYDVVIFGDVLEHLSVEDAQDAVARIAKRCSEMYVAVPYLYPQGEEEGNPYEAHLQDDLTPYVMQERYPMLKLLATDGAKGVYVKR